MDLTIRLLTTVDAAPLVTLRREALETCPLAFSSSPETDRFRDIDSAREHLQDTFAAWTFGAFAPHPETPDVSMLETSTVESAAPSAEAAPTSGPRYRISQQLVGMVGVYRNTRAKIAQKAYVVGMYVTSAARRRGVAAALLDTAIAHARTLSGVTQLHLSVMSAAPDALRLYQRTGFHLWGTEPASLIYNGQAVDEHHLMLILRTTMDAIT